MMQKKLGAVKKGTKNWLSKARKQINKRPPLHDALSAEAGCRTMMPEVRAWRRLQQADIHERRAPSHSPRQPPERPEDWHLPR